MPKSPIESFFSKVFDAVDEAAADLVREANRQARENMRRMARQLDQSTAPNYRTTPVASGRKRAQERSKPVGRPERPPTPQVTLYTVLEVSPRASIETITAAFRSLSTRFHPDTGKVKNENRYKEITAAWNVLKNVERRKAYDRSIGL